MENELTHPTTGKPVKSAKDLIKLWMAAKKKEAEAKKLIDFCKVAVNHIDVKIGAPIVGKTGIIRIEKRNTEYDKDALKRVVGDADLFDTFLKIDKTTVKKWAEEQTDDKIKEGLNEALVETRSPTIYFQLKELTPKK